MFQCPASGQGYRVPVPCSRLDCDTCRARVRRGRGGRLAERIGGKGIGTAVFTLPPTLRSRLGWRAIPVVRRLLAKAIKRWARTVFGQKIGFYICFHPAGDKDPGEWKPHFHVGWSLVGDVGPISRHLEEWELQTLKSEWATVQDELSLAVGVEPRSVNVHYSFHTAKTKVIHRCMYDARSFPEWSAESFDGTTFEGGMPTGVAMYVSYGLLSPRAGNDEWRDRVRLDVEEDTNKPENSGLKCHCCAVSQLLCFVVEGPAEIEEGVLMLHLETGELLHPD